MTMIIAMMIVMIIPSLQMQHRTAPIPDLLRLGLSMLAMMRKGGEAPSARCIKLIFISM